MSEVAFGQLEQPVPFVSEEYLWNNWRKNIQVLGVNLPATQVYLQNSR